MSNQTASNVTYAAVYAATGEPSEVLAWQEMPLRAPGPGEVLVALECAAVHPSDFGMISGTYGKKRELPAVAGREGVGRVEAVGAGVTTLAVGDRVRIPEPEGTWRERGVFAASACLKMPTDLTPEAAAQCLVNPPTAIRVLNDFVALKPGDIVVQNAGNSAVGRTAAFYGRQLGVKVVSLVRNADKLRDDLVAGGAALVLEDNDDAPKAIAAFKGDSKVRLALNSVGGASVMRLIKACDVNAVVVTFGGMVGDLVRFPTRELIFNNITLKGYWMDKWGREASPETLAAHFEAVYKVFRDGLPLPTDRIVPVSEVVSAVARSRESGRSGKVLLRGPAWK